MTDSPARSVPAPLRNSTAVTVAVAAAGVLAAAVVVALLGGDADHLLWALVMGAVSAGGVVGAYVVGRRYGQPHSHAFAQATVVFAVLVLAAVVAELLYASDRLSNGMIGLGLGGAVVGAALVVGLVAALDRVTAA